jgi:hypothetical protein
MEKGYKNIHWLFIAILLLAPLGFRKYILNLNNVTQSNYILHAHAILMITWCIMLIVQPILIKYRKYDLHKLIGKISYVIVPLIIFSVVKMIKFSYLLRLEQNSVRESLNKTLLPFTQIILFTMYYAAAIVKRQNSFLHMRFIIISSLILLSPIIGRFKYSFIDLNMINVSMWIVNIILIILIIHDYINKKNYKIYLIALFFYSLSHFIILHFGYTNIWQNFAKSILIHL